MQNQEFERITRSKKPIDNLINPPEKFKVQTKEKEHLIENSDAEKWNNLFLINSNIQAHHSCASPQRGKSEFNFN